MPAGGTIRVPYELLSDRDLTPTDKVLYSYLRGIAKLQCAERGDPDADIVEVSERRLASRLGLERKAVSRSLLRLLDQRLVVWEDAPERDRVTGERPRRCGSAHARMIALVDYEPRYPTARRGELHVLIDLLRVHGLPPLGALLWEYVRDRRVQIAHELGKSDHTVVLFEEQATIARVLGTTRETLNRCLSTLRHHGWIHAGVSRARDSLSLYTGLPIAGYEEDWREMARQAFAKCASRPVGPKRPARLRLPKQPDVSPTSVVPQSYLSATSVERQPGLNSAESHAPDARGTRGARVTAEQLQSNDRAFAPNYAESHGSIPTLANHTGHARDSLAMAPNHHSEWPQIVTQSGPISSQEYSPVALTSTADLERDPALARVREASAFNRVVAALGGVAYSTLVIGGKRVVLAPHLGTLTADRLEALYGVLSSGGLMGMDAVPAVIAALADAEISRRAAG
jgi:hypothetical protein